jgi:hypothetical protein
MHIPDYYGGSIVNLMASLQQGLGGQPHAYPQHRLLPAEKVSKYRQVFLWVIDGLGLNHLCAEPDAVHLNRHLLGGMTSVYPPTTASAITTYLTGDAPQQHALTGWHIYFRELGACIAVLPGTPRYGGVSLKQAGINVRSLLGTTPFTERFPGPSAALSPAYITDSDFNQCHLGASHLLSHRNLTELRDNAVQLLRKGGHRYLLAYWPELDTIGHSEGIWSEAARHHLLELDRCFGEIVEQSQDTNTLIIVCADHGQIDTEASDRLSLDDHPQLTEYLSLPLCGESRSAYCYLRPGTENAFDDYVKSQLSSEMSIYPSSELIERGWFGLAEPHPELHHRIGDRLLRRKSHYTLNDWLPQERRHELIGVHGGLSEDELLVPLIVVAN